jgi:hypothetical protein
MSPVRYEPGFYIRDDDILHSHRRENPKSYIFKWLSYIAGLQIYYFRKPQIKNSCSEQPMMNTGVQHYGIEECSISVTGNCSGARFTQNRTGTVSN